MGTARIALSLILLNATLALAVDRHTECRWALTEADALASVLDIDPVRLTDARNRAFSKCKSPELPSEFRARALVHRAATLPFSEREAALALLSRAADEMRGDRAQREGLIILLDGLVPYVHYARGVEATLEIVQEALRVREETFPAVSEQVARGLVYVGLTQEAVGELVSAEASYRRAVAIARKCCRAPDEVLFGALDALADLIEQDPARQEEAARLREEALLALP